jgi:hypothetical protein
MITSCGNIICENCAITEIESQLEGGQSPTKITCQQCYETVFHIEITNN